MGPTRGLLRGSIVQRQKYSSHGGLCSKHIAAPNWTLSKTVREVSDCTHSIRVRSLKYVLSRELALDVQRTGKFRQRGPRTATLI